MQTPRVAAVISSLSLMKQIGPKGKQNRERKQHMVIRVDLLDKTCSCSRWSQRKFCLCLQLTAKAELGGPEECFGTQGNELSIWGCIHGQEDQSPVCQAMPQQTRHGQEFAHIQRERFELSGENCTNPGGKREGERVSFQNLESIPVYFCLPVGERAA